MTKIPLRDNKRDLLIKINEFHDEVTINSVTFDTIYHGDNTKKNASTYRFLVQ